MSELTVSVKGVTCDHCVQAITGAVSAVPGVTDVDVDVAAGEVFVAGDGVDPAAVRASIGEAGYEAVT